MLSQIYLSPPFCIDILFILNAFVVLVFTLILKNIAKLSLSLNLAGLR